MPAVVRAKFKVDAITRQRDYSGKEIRSIKMTPVYSNDPNSENAKFWAATPSGSIELGCANAAASECFELGKQYYVDFTPAE